jgi:hypothetical protein
MRAGLPVRPDQRRQDAAAAEHRRRVHQGGARDARRAQHHRRADRRGPAGAGRRARLPRERPLRQRTRADRHALRGWCTSTSVTTSYIEPGAPWQNPFAESFNARVRGELLNLKAFSCLAEAQILARTGASTTTGEHPHSALGYRSPDAFATAWSARRSDPAPATRRGRRDGLGPPGLHPITPCASPTTVPAATTHRPSHAVDQQPGSGQQEARSRSRRPARCADQRHPPSSR